MLPPGASASIFGSRLAPDVTTACLTPGVSAFILAGAATTKQNGCHLHCVWMAFLLINNQSIIVMFQLIDFVENRLK